MDNIRVMLVEDERLIALDIQNSLESLGFVPVGNVATGEEAIDWARRERPDAILMDIRLRGDMDGIEAAQEIDSNLNIPVIFLSSYADDSTIDRARKVGAYGYLVKPFEDRELRATIETALYKAEMEAKLRESEERYRMLFENAREGIAVIQDEKALFVNPRVLEITGYSQDELAERDIFDFVHADDHHVVRRNYAANMAGEKTRSNFPFRIIAKDGETKWLAANSVQIAWEGKPAILSFYADITRRKQALEPND